MRVNLALDIDLQLYLNLLLMGFIACKQSVKKLVNLRFKNANSVIFSIILTTKLLRIKKYLLNYILNKALHYFLNYHGF